MDVYDAIKSRRSLKPEQLLPDPIDRALLDKLFDAANWAPSHGLTEPWRFIVFTGDAKTALAKAVVTTMKKPGEAPLAAEDPIAASTIAKMTRPPVVVAIVCASSTNPKIVEHEEICSTAMAVQNLHLLARSMGLGGYWSSGNKAFDPRMAEFLGITAPSRCLGFFYLGWPAVPWPEGARRSIAEKVTWRS
jgi:nitroreductase